MGNKLKKMLDKNDKGLNISFKFKTPIDRENFIHVIDQLNNTGIPQETPIPVSIEITKKKGNYEYPVKSVDNIVQIMVYPERDVAAIPIKIDETDEEMYLFVGTKTDEIIHLISINSKIVEVKMDFMLEDRQVNFTYTSHPDKAKNMQELIKEYKKFLALLDRIFLHNNQDQKIEDIKRYFNQSIKAYSRAKELSDVLGIELTPEQLFKEDNEGYIIEKFYLLLVKRSIIRQDDKLNHIELAEIESMNVGQKLFATYYQTGVLEIFDEKKDIFLVNCFFGAEICKIEKKQDGNYTVYFKDSETYPMYHSYSAFLCKEDAEKEMNQIENKRESYEKAVNWIEQIRELL